MDINVLKENFLMSTSKGVYLIRNKQNGLLKIGRTNNIERRYGEIIKSFEFCGISASNIILEKFIECSEEVRLERELHKELENYNVQNEWFDIKDYDIVEEALMSIIEKDFMDKMTSKIEKDFMDKMTSNSLEIEGNFKNDLCFIIDTISNTNLSSNAKLLYMWFANNTKDTFSVVVSGKQLQTILSCSRVTVLRTLKELEDNKYIYKVSRFDKDTYRQLNNMYCVIPITENGIDTKKYKLIKNLYINKTIYA